MAVYPKQQELLLAKLETTYGTDPSPSATADVIQVVGGSINADIKKEVVEIEEAGYYEPTNILSAGITPALSFDVYFKGSGTGDTPPQIGRLIKACGFSETIDSTNLKVEYDALGVGTEWDSITAYLYRGDALEKIFGGRGTFKITAEAGKPLIGSFEFKGSNGSVASSTYPSFTVSETTTPPIVLSATFTVGGNSYVVEKVEIDIGNVLSAIPDITTSSGIYQVVGTGRKITGTFRPAKTTSENWWDDVGGSSMALQIQAGSDTGNTITIDIPAVVVNKRDWATIADVWGFDIGFQVIPSSGEYIKITFS